MSAATATRTSMFRGGPGAARKRPPSPNGSAIDERTSARATEAMLIAVSANPRAVAARHRFSDTTPSYRQTYEFLWRRAPALRVRAQPYGLLISSYFVEPRSAPRAA